MKKAYTIFIIGLIALIASITPVHAQDESDLLFGWSYPYNNSTYRVYSAHLARFKYISEIGIDYTEYDGEYLDQDTVSLFGDVDSGDVWITRLHPTCWRVEMTSDYSLLRKTWKANEEFDGKCYQYYFPFVEETQ